MTFRDPRLESPLDRPGVQPENHQDIVPPNERGQDNVRDEFERGWGVESSRPLTDEERRAAEHDTPVGERVYAPASERVPRAPVPGHRDFVEHPDTHTPEREAVSRTMPTMPTPTPGAYASAQSNPGLRTGDTPATDDWSAWPTRSRSRMFFGLGAGWFGLTCTAIGVWLFMRWRHERNKPINRIRRQAQHAAAELRDRVPSPDEAAKPAVGLTTAVLSLLMIWWQQSQARSRGTTRKARKMTQRAADTLSEADWQHRLLKLKERWSPGRVELEKVSISRHH